LKVPFEIGVFLFALMVSLPMSIAVFPKTGKMPVSSLIKEEQDLLREKGY